MRKRHGAGTDNNRTLCGFECSSQEYISMKSRQTHRINCRHCLAKLGLKKRLYAGRLVCG
jgi:hypothetical protein